MYLNRKKNLTLVIPVLNEEENIVALRKRLEPVLAELSRKDIEVEIIVNNNASKDQSLKLLHDWSIQDSRVIVQTFANTVSFQTSLMRGIKRAAGDGLIVLQSDLQDPPELIPELVDEWLKGNRVVGAIANNKHSSGAQHLFRNVFYKLLLSSSAQNLIPNFQDFYLLDRVVYSEIALRNEQFQFIRGVIAAEFGIDSTVTYRRETRYAGKSKFKLLDKYDLAIDGLLVFGSRFIRTLAVVSFLTSAIAFLALTVYLLLRIVGFDFGVPGWATLVALVLFVLGIMLAFFSITFEFLYRILRLLVKQ